MTTVRRLVIAVGIAAALVPGPVRASDTVHLQASLFRFCGAGDLFCRVDDSPHVTAVTTGQTVDWIFNDPACDALMSCGHNVTFADGQGGPTLNDDGFDPVAPRRPLLFSRTFTAPGTYRYFCTAHGPEGMLGTIVVS